MKLPRPHLLWVLFFAAGLTACSDPSPTTNTVRSIELAALENMVSKEDFNGVVVAMASWCPPCKEELPLLAGIYRNYQHRGIQIVAFSIDEEGPAVVQPLINELKIPFPVYWVGKAAIQHFKIIGIPTLLVYHRGQLIEKIPGSQTRKAIEQKIDALLIT